MIRSACEKDIESLGEIEKYNKTVLRHQKENDRQYYMIHYPEYFFVLEEENRIIGYIYGRTIDQLADCDQLEHSGQRWLLIAGLGILPDHEKQQMTLVYHMMEQASLQHLSGCLVIEKKGRHIDLKKFGFRLCQYPVLNDQDFVIYRFAFHQIKQTRLSRYISFVLRHHPEDIGATLDRHGWMNVDELITGLRKKGKYIDRNILKEIVESDEKQRYHFNDDQTRIRAAQGHSISVDVEMTEKQPPDVLYHGTSLKNYELIKTSCIKKMNRQYVHLSKDIETAQKVGRRHGQPVILVIDTGRMYRDGCRFYLSANGVWLCDDIDCRYIVEVIEQTDHLFPGK